MYKLFTLQEANHMIPIVDRHLREIQVGANEASALKLALKHVKPNSLKSRSMEAELSFVRRSVEDAKAELDRMGVQLRDVKAGVVEFPSQMGAEIVCLSWQQGDAEITRYHRLSDGRPTPLAAQTATR